MQLLVFTIVNSALDINVPKQSQASIKCHIYNMDGVRTTYFCYGETFSMFCCLFASKRQIFQFKGEMTVAYKGEEHLTFYYFTFLA